eukprot:TRINITY_DN99527_c0_g1_i1.p1 TRINITY_DN99527_c0_g1~~TRINITY_DN99527_c0_g1_i1.p1  ORF type:complete len:210 (-),score=48.80 TRINITY_DN99527_c0_g1_i1:123-752(-)
MADVKALIEWRLKHGETEQGRPFYDKKGFADWCNMVNLANQQSEEGKSSAKVTPASVEELHRSFVEAEDGDLTALANWKAMSDLLKETARIEGVLDAPLRESGERAVHRAAQLGRCNNLKWLRNNGADIVAATAPALDMAADGSASSSLCPAHMAAMHGQVAALAMLKELGADLNCKRPDGAQPLDFAEDAEEIEAAKWLTANGARKGL